MTFGRVLAPAGALLLAACGGTSVPTTPTQSAPIPAAQACDLVGGIGSTISIYNGAECNPERGPVVQLNMRDAAGSAGACSGTIIAPRAVLTAAHCLDGGITGVLVWLGVGPQYTATSFAYHPRFDTSSLQFDIGVVLLGEDLPRAPSALLMSRSGRIGEPAILAGFGRNEIGETTRLRAGSTLVSNVTATRLETKYAPPSSSICSGDSGGPIFLSEGGGWVLAGISSATTQTACNDGTNYYQALNPTDVRTFIEQYVPSVTYR
ncbi:MAG TPA: trypsin-like serine protease [Vicinamibacterales bacterium]|nr:trypsin-like serine protease [Vicinamibacterales bacterium]